MSITELANKPLNELTEEEAAEVIAWNAKMIAESESFKKAEEERAEAMRQWSEHARQAKLQCMETLSDLKERALAFYESQGGEHGQA